MGLPHRHRLLWFFAIVFFGSILLGPALYFAVGCFFPLPFHRAMDRALLLSSLAALAVFWPSISFAQLWPLQRRSLIQLGFGYLLALVSAQAMIGLDLAVRGFTSAHLSAQQIGARVLMALIAALLIPPLEETVFRGFLLLELAQKVGRRWGCVLAALIFMLAHFLKIPETLDHQPVHFWSGVNALGDAFLPIAHGDFLGGHGANLFLVGMILGGIFLRAGTLWINAGLHSGWIFALLLFSGLTRPLSPPNTTAFGNGDLLSTPLTSLVLILLAAWLWRYYPPRSDEPGSGESAPST
jgi:membrane protease YdiL (CAAX protease family)